MNFAGREHGLAPVNTFSRIYLGEVDHHLDTKRQPIPLAYIRSVQGEGEKLNDQRSLANRTYK